MTEKKALVLDGRTLSSLAVARSLGKQNYSIHCGESFKWNITHFSKYVARTVSYPSAEDEPSRFVKTLLNIVRQMEYDVVIPTRDATTELLAANQDQFGKYTNLYLPTEDIISTFMDKGETIKLANEAGIPTPKTYFPEDWSLEAIADEASYPVLVRPRRSAGSRGITRVESKRELKSAFHAVESEYGTPIVQEFVEKSGYTTACILLNDDQKVVASFSYERIKEYPLSGGPTVVGKSTDDAEAKEYASQLLSAGEWRGVAEVEFIIDQGGIPRLLEVNPRFWMPVQLAIEAGVDFPHLVTKLAEGRVVNHSNEYTIGVNYRWVLPNEILHMLKSENSFSDLREVLRSPLENTCYGVLSLDDPAATVGTVAQSVAFLFDEEKRRTVLERGW